MLFSEDQPHALQHLLVDLRADGHIDAGGLNGRVAQNVRQEGQILFLLVKAPGKQMAQIVRKDLGTQNPRLRT